MHEPVVSPVLGMASGRSVRITMLPLTSLSVRSQRQTTREIRLPESREQAVSRRTGTPR